MYANGKNSLYILRGGGFPKSMWGEPILRAAHITVEREDTIHDASGKGTGLQ